MAMLAYIRQLHPNSFVHLSYRGSSWAVRDFKHGVEPIYSNQTMNYSAQDIIALAKQTGNHLFDVPLAREYKNLEFWREKIQEKNAEFLATSTNKPDVIEEQLSVDERDMLLSYRKLSAANQKVIVKMINSLLES